MSLFQLGDFTLHSGRKSRFKIDCDYLTDSDMQALAAMMAAALPPFKRVEGIPRGGLRLAEALQPYCQPGDAVRPSAKVREWLIVDDVWTTGGSLMRIIREKSAGLTFVDSVIGAVIFARSPMPSLDIHALFWGQIDG